MVTVVEVKPRAPFKPFDLTITVSSHEDSDFILKLVEFGLENLRGHGGFSGPHQGKALEFLNNIKSVVVAKSK